MHTYDYFLKSVNAMSFCTVRGPAPTSILSLVFLFLPLIFLTLVSF